jgi:hypothetical protein
LELSAVLALFEEQERNSRWFKECYQRLAEEFDVLFVAIHEQEVVAFDEDPAKLREKVLASGLSLMDVTVEYVSKKPLEFIL